MSIPGNYFTDKMYDLLKPLKMYFNNEVPIGLYIKKLNEAEKIINDLLINFKDEHEYVSEHQGRIVNLVKLTYNEGVNPFTGVNDRSVNIEAR